MDKPELIDTIIKLIPSVDLHYIKMAAIEELERQRREQVMAILHKKSPAVLEAVISYEPPVVTVAKVEPIMALASTPKPYIKKNRK